MYKAKFAKYNNRVPFKDFLDSLTINEKVEIFAAIDKLLEFKNKNSKIPQKLSKSLKNGIFELRVRHLNRISRSLYFYQKDKLLIFTNGFIKKSEKTPKKEIEKAINIKNEHHK